jgi:chromate transporter
MTTSEPSAGAGPSWKRVAIEWGRIGCTGFGGPPAHIRMLRDLCVRRQGWIDPTEFEDAVAACNLLPGPASTQLSIFCAMRVRGRLGAVVGGLAFIVPGLVLIVILSALFLSSAPPRWIEAAGAGGGAAVAAVAVHAALGLLPASWCRSAGSRARWTGYVAAGTVSAATLGAWLVVVLIGCGAIELAVRFAYHGGGLTAIVAGVPVTGAVTLSTIGSVIWVAFKVGALSYGGGFVIIPLMQADAVNHYHWMTNSQFLSAVALGQVTPGPVVQTVSAVGYAAAGLLGALIAAVVAFSPSFAFILLGANRFERLRVDHRARAFLDGAGPAAIGAILGAGITLALALVEPWQYAILAAAAIMLLALRRGVVLTLLASAAAGIIVVAAGAAVPR